MRQPVNSSLHFTVNAPTTQLIHALIVLLLPIQNRACSVRVDFAVNLRWLCRQARWVRSDDFTDGCFYSVTSRLSSKCRRAVVRRFMFYVHLRQRSTTLLKNSNEVDLHPASLVLGWVTVFRRVIHFNSVCDQLPVTQTNSTCMVINVESAIVSRPRAYSAQGRSPRKQGDSRIILNRWTRCQLIWSTWTPLC